MSITAFPVLARILIDRNLLGTPVGSVAIACAAFDDVTGWLILAGIVTTVHSSHSGSLVLHVVLLAAYILVMTMLVRPALRWVGRRRAAVFGDSAEDLVVVLIVVLASAVTTEWLGVHALFGAFFAGLMMPRHSRIERICIDRIEPVTMTLMLP